MQNLHNKLFDFFYTVYAKLTNAIGETRGKLYRIQSNYYFYEKYFINYGKSRPIIIVLLF